MVVYMEVIKMNKIYEMVRNYGRKYVVPAVIGLTALVGGCSKVADLSSIVQEDTISVVRKSHENERDNAIFTAKSSLETALKSFDDSISDSRFSKSEQEGVYSLLKETEASIKKAEEITEKYGLKQNNRNTAVRDKNIQTLYSLLKENLYGDDSGTPELQKKLQKGGLFIDVEQVDTEEDLKGVTYGALGSLFAYLAFATAIKVNAKKTR